MLRSPAEASAKPLQARRDVGALARCVRHVAGATPTIFLKADSEP
jgi:hypothetical protein